MRKGTLLTSAALALITVTVQVHAENPLWSLTSGKWAIDTQSGVCYDTVARSTSSGYNEIFDMNSVTSFAPLEKVNKIESEFAFFAPMSGNKGMIFFGAASQRNFYALRFTGTQELITTLTLIRSDVKDTTLPGPAKNNFVITELTHVPVSIKWGDEITATITLKKKNLKASVNGASIDYKLPEELPPGKIGFSHVNNLMRINGIKAYYNDKIVLEDDFSRDRIKRIVVELKRSDPKEKK